MSRYARRHAGRRRPAGLRKARPTGRQWHRDAALSRRGRLIWWSVIGVLVVGGIVAMALAR